MRELKFRYYDAISKRFVYSDEFNYVSMFDILPLFFTKGKLYASRNIVQQYTNLTDSTGKEIYEGDYIQLTEENEINLKIGVVEYEKDCGRYIIKGLLYSKNQNYIDLTCDSIFNAKIIGNIFEGSDVFNL